jgi:lysophospholipase L1-like esterase
MAFGNSNTFLPDGSNTRWTVLLEDKAPDHFDVFNEGCDGRTTQYDTGERNALSVIGNKMTGYAPLDYVILMLGTNDVKSQYGPPSADDIADGMRRILNSVEARNGGAEPILTTPPPLGDLASGDLAGAQSRIPPVAAKYRFLAMNRDIRLVDLNTIVDSSTDLEPDRVHLNAAGRRKVADAVWANLRDLTAPAQVTGFSGLPDGDNFHLTWRAVSADTFYYRVRKNGEIIGRTLDTEFEVIAPATGDVFTVEAVDFSQNTGMASEAITYNKRGLGSARSAN